MLLRLFGFHQVGLHSSYVSHVLPYLIVSGNRVGDERRPGLQHRHSRVGTSGRRRGIGHTQHRATGRGIDRYALLNTVAASAATSYLVGRALTPANVQAALLHSYRTVFFWSSLIFWPEALLPDVVLQRGGLRALASEKQVVQVQSGIDVAPRVHVSRVRVGCR